MPEPGFVGLKDYPDFVETGAGPIAYSPYRRVFRRIVITVCFLPAKSSQRIFWNGLSGLADPQV
jgi:hypothetical protein